MPAQSFAPVGMSTAAKSALRAQAMNRRKAVLPAEAATACRNIALSIGELWKSSPPLTVGAYIALPGELDVSLAMRALEEAGHNICLPIAAAAGQSLIFRLFRPGDSLTAGPYGTREPKADQPVAYPDCLLIPLLAYDGQGHRLGYGGGYYDRTLAELPPAGVRPRKVGVAYAFQRHASLPAEPHDQRLDAVVTENGVESFS